MPNRLAALAALLAVAAPAAARPPQQPRPADPALVAVPTDAFGFVSVKASKLWDNPAAKPLRDWVAAQKEGPLDDLLGVQPGEIDRVTMFAATWQGPAGGAPVLLVTTRQQYNEAKVLKALKAGNGGRGREPRVTGRAAELTGGEFRWVVFVDDRTLLYLSRDFDDKVLGGELVGRLIARKPDGPLAAALSAAPDHDVTVGLDVRAVRDFVRLWAGDELPRDLAPYHVLLQAKTATLTADFDKTAKGKLVLTFPDAATAKRAAPVLEEGIKTVAADILAGRDRLGPDTPQKLLSGWAVSALKNAKVTADGADVVAAADVPFADDLATFAAALPKSFRAATDRMTASNNLKQLGLAMHTYHDVIGQFPGDVGWLGADKNPAVSWRVSILPYIEQDNLFKRLNPEKPWDDDANQKVLAAAEMPKVFEHPGRPAPKGHTYFRVFSFPKDAKGNDRPIFEEGRRGPRLIDITDGTSNTLMIVEAGEAVPWYKPDVLAYDGKLPLPQLGAKDADLFLAVMGDASVRSLRPSRLGEKTLRALITRAGGEVIPDIDR